MVAENEIVSFVIWVDKGVQTVVVQEDMLGMVHQLDVHCVMGKAMLSVEPVVVLVNNYALFARV